MLSTVIWAPLSAPKNLLLIILVPVLMEAFAPEFIKLPSLVISLFEAIKSPLFKRVPLLFKLPTVFIRYGEG